MEFEYLKATIRSNRDKIVVKKFAEK